MRPNRALEIGTGLFVLLGFRGAVFPDHAAARERGEARQLRRAIT